MIRKSSDSLQYHAGFVLFDPTAGKTILDINGNKFFTPASNTKVFTLLACSEILGDTVTGVRYRVSGDSLIFQGTGDPSLLNPDTWSGSSVWQALKSFPGSLFLDDFTPAPAPYGPGWMWDDYDAYFQSERSALPVYGNSVRLKRNAQRLKVSPRLFFDSVNIVSGLTNSFRRDLHRNQFRYETADTAVRTIPIFGVANFTRHMLSDTLGRPVGIYNGKNHTYDASIPGVPADSLYKTMMQVSDNFIAEQLLLMAGLTISDTLDNKPAMTRVIRKYFSGVRPPVWADGSGLSRYNQMTPHHIISAWRAIGNNIPRERLFPLLTQNPALPFIHAKSGSMRNVWCLGGFMETRSGKTLLFSSMNANFTVPARRICSDVEKILQLIHDKY